MNRIKIRSFLAAIQVAALLTGVICTPVMADETVSSDSANEPPIVEDSVSSDGSVVTDGFVPAGEPVTPENSVSQDEQMTEETSPSVNSSVLTGNVVSANQTVTVSPDSAEIPEKFREYLEMEGFSYKDGSLYYYNLKLNEDAMYEDTDENGNVWYYDPLDPEFLQYFAEEAGTSDRYKEPQILKSGQQKSGSSFTSGINGQTYSYPSYVNGKQVINGVDVSYYQKSINWSALAARGVRFAIIRAGYRGYGDAGNMREDTMCHTYIEGARAAGIKVGIYFLSQAKNEDEAEDEARKCRDIIDDYEDDISLPVFMDYEYAGDPGRLYKQHQKDWNSGGDYRSKHTDVVNAFCDKMDSYGYDSGVYCNRSMLESQLRASEIPSEYYVWLANYTSATPYTGRIECWQYTSTYKGFGSSGYIGCENIDLDFWFGSFPGEDDEYVDIEPEVTDYGSATDVSVSYRTHVQNVGWQGYRSNGVIAGTTGRSLRLEGINIRLSGRSGLGVQYTTHCQDYGWLTWSADDDMSGTEGESKRLEAIKIQLTGANKDKYDIWYRVHAQDVGWMGWARNGAPAGTAGYARRLEGIQILISNKGAGINAGIGGISSVTATPYLDKNNDGNPVVPNADVPNVSYRTHVQNEGWQPWRTNGGFAGTSGRSLRLEGINIKLTNRVYSGSIRYKTHIENIGWQDWKYDGEMAGTSGRSLRLEAINIELTGDMARLYDVYYRVHAQDVGWMGWARNGASAGTAGYFRRLEGIQIILVKKGSTGPGSNYGGIVQNEPRAFISR